MSAADESTTLPNTAEIGNTLRQQREKKQFTLEDVARELHLPARQVAALESGRFSEFRSAVFVKGYLRACAKLYGMDGDTLVRAYEQAEPQAEVVLRSPLAQAQRIVISSPRRTQKYWLVLALLLLIAAAAVWYGRWAVQKVEQSTALTRDVPAEQAVASDDVVDAVLDNASAQSAVAASNTAPELVANLPPALQPSTSEATPNNAATSSNDVALNSSATTQTADNNADAQDATLHMEFSDDCWVQIKDDAGKILHEKNYRKGEVLDLTAPPPLHVWLGRVAAANVSYNGALVSVPAKSGYQTAQFVLGDDTQSSRVE
jgi:cytoskeleton protein RodZ